MAFGILSTQGGEIGSDEVTGPDSYSQVTESGGSYDSGGYSIPTDLIRVDTGLVETDNEGQEARVVSTNENFLIVGVYEADGTAQVTGGTDLSNDEFSYQAILK